MNRGKKVSWCITLAKSMDPTRLAVSTTDLNLKLMRWRALPSLDLNMLSATKCLLLGAGTLGCQVARMLMAWGVRKITLLDSGKLAMSNPLRQFLYTLNDCLNGGEFKAVTAVKSLKQIFPAVITITAALGFESFLVMRHGAGPHGAKHGLQAESVDALPAEMGNFSLKDGDGRQLLGCYFCSDSTTNRTLDQQGTVTRPGLAPIASALAVELLVGILHHRHGIFAQAEFDNSGDS